MELDIIAKPEPMTKAMALDIFGGTPEALATALGVSYSAVKAWPAELTLGQRDRVVGAACRHGLVDRLPEAHSPVIKHPPRVIVA